MEYASKGVAGSGLGLGIAGTALGLLNANGGGLLGGLLGGNYAYGANVCSDNMPVILFRAFTLFTSHPKSCNFLTISILYRSPLQLYGILFVLHTDLLW